MAKKTITGQINPLTDVDYWAAIRKLFGDQSADVLPGYDNVQAGTKSGMKVMVGTDANAPGGSKYVAPVSDTGTGTGTGQTSNVVSDNNLVVGGGTPVRTLDQAQIDSLLSRLASTDVDLRNAIAQATLSRDASRREKEEELERETGKFDTKILGNTQDFGENINDSELMTRETLNNLVSSMSVLGLGGSQELTRQILDASTRSNREANATQARNAQDLTSAFNDFSSANKNDLLKIDDQFNYAKGEAKKAQAKERQNILQRMADAYEDGGRTADRERVMREADSLNSVISNSTFLNPQYRGETRVMATPELGEFTQETPQYQLGTGGGVTPAGVGSASSTALGMKTAPINEQDFGVKKKTEGSLGYGL